METAINPIPAVLRVPREVPVKTEVIAQIIQVTNKKIIGFKITDSLLAQIKEWQHRPLESIYPFVFMDTIHYKVREDGQNKSKGAYVVLSVKLDGMKEVIGKWIGENESSKFLLDVLNDIKNRGVEEILIFSVDGKEFSRDLRVYTGPLMKKSL